MDRISWEGGEANPVQSTLLRHQPQKNDINNRERREEGEGGSGQIGREWNINRSGTEYKAQIKGFHHTGRFSAASRVCKNE